MQKTNFIKITKIEELKKYVTTLCERQTPVRVTVKKTRSKIETHEVVVEGVYPKFFTVKNTKMRLSFTVQYVDVITGNVSIEALETEEN